MNHQAWLRRPLPEENLLYASMDIHLIWLLYKHFKQKGYLGDQLLEQSARYISLWKDTKPQQNDDFKCHSLLPLQVIEDDQYHTTCRTCKGCQRSFPNKAFSNPAWKNASKRYCWVCRAINIRNQLHATWERDQEEYGYDMSDDGYMSF